MIYLAKYRNTMVYLSSSNQMQSYMRAGFEIYEEAPDGTRSLIATPEDGFLIDPPPVFPTSERAGGRVDT